MQLYLMTLHLPLFSIPSQFADGKSLQETFDLIAKREMRKRDLPIIDVFWKEGAYWTLSNRRLAVFSELERRKLAKQVKIKIIPFDENAHGEYEPFFAYWRKNQPHLNDAGEVVVPRPWPGGLPDGWGGDEPVFSPNLAGEITVIEKPAPMETDAKPAAGAKTAIKTKPAIDPKPATDVKSLPPLVKMSSSGDETGGAREAKPPLVAASAPSVAAPIDP